jgi:site-specific recombinase XerD
LSHADSWSEPHVGVGDRCGQPVLAAVMKRLGAIANTTEDLRHPHALRHTCATLLLRSGATLADVQRLLGHASVKTTSIYLASDEQRQEDVITRREHGRRPSTRTAIASA